MCHVPPVQCTILKWFCREAGWIKLPSMNYLSWNLKERKANGDTLRFCTGASIHNRVGLSKYYHETKKNDTHLVHFLPLRSDESAQKGMLLHLISNCSSSCSSTNGTPCKITFIHVQTDRILHQSLFEKNRCIAEKIRTWPKMLSRCVMLS